MLNDLLPAPDSVAWMLWQAALTLLVLSLLARLLSWVLWRLIKRAERFSARPLSERRSNTLRGLLSSTLNAFAVLVTLLMVMGMFVPASALATTLGLFSAGLGFGALPYIKDFLGGVLLLFEDQFAIGEKVEIGERNVIGVVEKVSLRTTHIRGEAGELWIVPNGDVRTVRNFSRGSFSPANIRLTVPTAKLDTTLALLADIIADPGPDVVETPEIISEEGEIGENTTLLIKIKARHGVAPLVRRSMLARLQAALAESEVIAH